MTEPSSIFSLPYAVQAIAHEAGVAHDFDDINALLGLSMMFCAVPGEGDVSRWQMYARDAFLIEGAQALGFTIRPIHPPEAARGLDDAREFAQHFDASYRPLILRALENGQPVLAWRGWEAPHELLWGMITDACAEGAGFRGRLLVDPSPPSNEGQVGGTVKPATVRTTGTSPRIGWAGFTLHLLARPAVQLYVVESVAREPERGPWLRLALAHASAALNEEVGERFGVVTGLKAFDEWRRRLVEAESPELTGGAVSDAPWAALARSTVAAHESAVRFLDKHRAVAPVAWHSRLATLERECQNVVMTLKPMGDAGHVGAWLATESGRAVVAAKLAAVREATYLMRTALIGLA